MTESGARVQALSSARERALRQQSVTEVSERLISGDLVLLVGDDNDWYRHDGRRWRALTHKEIEAKAAAALEEWWFGETSPTEVQAEVAGTACSWRGSDVNEVVSRMIPRSQPAGWELVREMDKERSFNLDTGELLDGVPFDDALIRISESGDLEEWDLEQRDFVRWSTGFDWPGEVRVPPANFKDWLDFLMPDDEDDQDALCAIIGAVLAGALPRMQAMLLLIGEGGTGKGTLQKLIDVLHGGDASYGVRTPANLANRFSLSHLRGKHLLVVADMSRRPSRGSAQADFDAGMGTIKNLTGGDPVDVEVKNQNARSRTLDVAVIVGSNFQPRWVVGSEDASAWERRLLVFEFFNKPEQSSARFLENSLVPEAAEIAAYCLGRYAWRVRQRSVSGGDLSVSDFRSEAMDLRIASIVEAARGEAGMFVAQEVALTNEAEAFLLRKHLTNAFAQFLGSKEVSDGQRNALFREVEFSFPQATSRQRRVNGKRERGYDGLMLVNASEDADYAADYAPDDYDYAAAAGGELFE